VTRGLELSSYAYPTSRSENVKNGSMLETPCFEWLDGAATKTTTFYYTLQRTGNPDLRKDGGKECPALRHKPCCGKMVCDAIPSFEVTLF
jgi:hypothetical protein